MKALELAPVDKDLCVLTDSLSAIHLLCRWLRCSLFTPYVSSVRCPDIVQSVLGNLGRRSRGTANTTLAGHSKYDANDRDTLRVLDGTFVQLCCAPSGTLFPELMEKFPGLTECPILESWKHPF